MRRLEELARIGNFIQIPPGYSAMPVLSKIDTLSQSSGEDP